MNNTNGTGAGGGNSGNCTQPTPCVAIYCNQGSGPKCTPSCGCPVIPVEPPGGGEPPGSTSDPLCAAPNNVLASGSRYEFWQNAFVKECSNKFYLGSPSGNFGKPKFANAYHG